MLNGGDEIGRSQQGNNNCYCQDNELTWHDWQLDEPREQLLEFTRRLIHLRLSHPNLHRRKFFQDREIRKKGETTLLQDIAWYSADGSPASDEVWNTTWNKSIAIVLNGQTLQVTDEEGIPIIDDSFLLIVNAAPEGVEFRLPTSPSEQTWGLILNTEDLDNPLNECQATQTVIVGGRALKLFRAKPKI